LPVKSLHRLWAFLLIVAGLMSPNSSAAAVSPAPRAGPENARAALEASVRALDLQTEFPAAGYRPSWTPGPSWTLPPELAQMILIAAAAVVLVIILLNLRDNWGRRGPSRRPAPEEEAAGPEAAAARLGQAQLAADELARQGRFAEAMHVLLLQSLTEFRRRLGLTIASSLTSREILARIGLAPEGRRALADIIGRVELSWFGARRSGAGDYAACRRSFEVLSGALRREGCS
jgi:hypothetical protein